MSNKRIRKKRNKQKLILNILQCSYTEMPESLVELRKTIRIMRKMTMPALLRLGQDIAREWIRRMTPFRPMLPRVIPHVSFDAGELVNWRTVVSQFQGEKP